MKKNHKDKSLAKKVLLSVVAAGVMSGFVLTAEAADIIHEDGQTHTYTSPVEAGKVTADKGSEIELNGGKIIGSKVERHDDQEPEVAFADIAADISDGSILNATNVDFTGGIEASGESKVVLNGGSVTAGSFYDKENKPLYSTEIGADGATIELNQVKIDSNLGAFDGGVITVNDSNVNADAAIVASGKGAVINLNSTDGSATYTVGEDGIEAEEGAAININGGKVNTSLLVANANTTITVKNADVKATEIIDADGANASITFDGTEKNVYNVDKGIVAENGGKIYIYGGTLKDDNLKSKMYGVKTEEGNTLNTADKGIVLDKNGVISTMSDQIYANAASATQKESGAITNEGIEFNGGSLILNDAQFTQSYSNSALAELKKQGVTKLTMNGELVKEETGEVKTEISVGEAADKFGSDTELDKVTAKAENNLLVGSNDTSLSGKDVAGINVQQQVGNGFAVGKLDLGAGSDGMVITNGKEGQPGWQCNYC